MQTFLIASDLHCGSPVGILPPKQWQLRGANISQNSIQAITYPIWLDVFTAFRKLPNRTIVFNGDLVEGVHHESKQVTTRYMQEQESIAIEAIDEGLRTAEFSDADKLYFVDGTAVHADESEERIAQDFSAAVRFAQSRTTFPALKLPSEAGELWIAHKGPGPGYGLGEGNALRNRLRDITASCLSRGQRPPRAVIYGHYHTQRHAQYEFGGHIVDGFILPAFAAKSEYGSQVASFHPVDIGGLLLAAQGNNLRWKFRSKEIQWQ